MNPTPNTPKEVISATISQASGKAGAAPRRTFLLAVMAGAFIALGAQSSSLAVHGIDNVGLARTLAGCIFPVGLLMIVFAGGELFTGDCMMSMAFMKKTISLRQLICTLLIVYAGNFCGGMIISTLVTYSGQFDYSSGALGAYTIKVAAGKVCLPFSTALISGILCNILVCTAVLMASAAKDSAGKILAVFFPILAFVVSGFEHCVANMYYIPAGILASGNEAYLRKAGELFGITPAQTAALTWSNMLLSNLVPVTIGNIIGGAVFVGGICYYLHGRSQE